MDDEVRDKRVLQPQNYYAADLEFGRAFAVFLRQYPQLWRIRRTDRFRPFAMHLAHREIDLHGRIPPTLVEHFLLTAGSELTTSAPPAGKADPTPGEPTPAVEPEGALRTKEPPAVAVGDAVTALIPIARRPKRLLLQSHIDRGGEGPLDALSRYEDSWLEALNLLSRTKQQVDELILANPASARTLHPVKPEEEFPLLLFFATLVFQNPSALRERVYRWSKENGITFGPGSPLSADDLKCWIRDQGDFFHPGVGSELAELLGPLIPELQDSKLVVPPPASSSPLYYFGSVPSLFLHAIRDFLKLIYSASPSWPESDSGWGGGQEGTGAATAEELLDDEAAFAESAYHLLLDGIVLAEEKLSDQPDWVGSEVWTELGDSLDHYWAYTQADIRLGVPFNVHVSETLPLVRRPWPDRPKKGVRRRIEQWKRTCYRTGHFYPLALKDAQSVHIEVEVPHAELAIPPLERRGTSTPSLPTRRERPSVNFRQPRQSIREWWHYVHEAFRQVPVSLILLLPDGSGSDLASPIAFEYAFGAWTRPHKKLLHFYSSRQLHEAPGRDKFSPYLTLFIPLRLMPSVLIGYSAAVAAHLLAAIFVAGSLAASMDRGRAPSFFPEVVAVGLVAVSLSLWLTSNLSKDAIVNEKLVVARHLLEIAVAVILGAFAAFLIYFAAHGFAFPNPTSLSVSPASAARAASATGSIVRASSSSATGAPAPFSWLLGLLQLLGLH